MRKAFHGYILIAPVMIGCLVFTLVPFGIVLRYSFTQGYGAAGMFVGMEHYTKMFQNDLFRLAFFNTMKFLTIGLPLTCCSPIFWRSSCKSRQVNTSSLNLSFCFRISCPVAGTVLLIDLLFGEKGAVNGLFAALNLPIVEWLNGKYAFWVMILMYLWKNTGYSVILLLAGLVTVPAEQYESADLDGASAFQKFRYITTPQMWYSVFFALIFSVINAFKCFREIFLIGGEHPVDELYMLQHFINNCFSNLNYQKLSVASVLLLIVIIVFFGLFYAFVSRKEAFRE